MCREQCHPKEGQENNLSAVPAIPNEKEEPIKAVRKRRSKRCKHGIERPPPTTLKNPTNKKKRKKIRHASCEEEPSHGGMEAILPSLAVLSILAFALLAKLGFRGRIEIAGIDLGTTNSVICIQALSSTVGEIDCLPDPVGGSNLIPSVVSLDPQLSGISGKKQQVWVGEAAKRRIDSHPHSTIYHAKRFLGRRYDDVRHLESEYEFNVVPASPAAIAANIHDAKFVAPLVEAGDGILFDTNTRHSYTPERIGTYVVSHLLNLASLHLGYTNIHSAVIAVPAKFTPIQRRATAAAFTRAGIKVARILEEPTAAALAYGLHRKPNVNHILVYDFGGGTLDVCVLHVSEGYVEVLASAGDDLLGGADFDDGIVKFLLEKKVYKRAWEVLQDAVGRLEEMVEGVSLEERLADECDKLEEMPLCHISTFHSMAERMKITLSSSAATTATQSCLSLPNSYKSDDATTSIADFCQSLQPMEFTLTQTEFHTAASSLFERSIQPIRTLLHDLDLTATDIDEVVMVGGTTRMTKIRDLVHAEFPNIETLNTHIDPDITVAYGAASVID